MVTTSIFIPIRLEIDNQIKNRVIKNINHEVYVDRILSNGITFKLNNNNYYLRTTKTFDIDDCVFVESNDIEELNIQKSFDKYLKSININFKINKALKINLVGNKESIKRKVLNFFSKGPTYFVRYGPLIVLGNKNKKNESIVNKISNISLIHLFTISGFHINIIFYFFSKILSILKVKNKYFEFIILFFILIYVFLISFPISSIRSLIFLFLMLVNKKWLKNRFNNFDLLSFTFIFLIIFNPYLFFSLSFIFSFFMTFSIFLTNKIKLKKFQKLKHLLIIWFFSLFIGIYLNNEINLTSFFGNIILTPIISLTYILSILFFYLKDVLDNWYLIVDIFINFFSLIKFSFPLYLSTEIIIYMIYFLFTLKVLFIDKPLLSEIEINKKNFLKTILNMLNKY